MLHSLSSIVRWHLILLASLVLSISVNAAPPELSGFYDAGDLGYVELVQQGSRLIGRVVAGGKCGVTPNINAISGVIEGNVLVATVLLCQEGPKCRPQQVYPWLAVHRNRTLVGRIQFRAGCRSPASSHGQIVLRAVTGAEAQGLSQKRTLSAGRGQSTSTARLIQGWLEVGQASLNRGDYAAAIDLFRLAVAYDESNAVALLGLGVAQTKLKDAQGAVESLGQAIELSKSSRASATLIAQMYYNLACAESQMGQRREALASLREAIATGGEFQLADELETDPDLIPIRSDPEFRRIVSDAKRAREKQQRYDP